MYTYLPYWLSSTCLRSWQKN